MYTNDTTLVPKIIQQIIVLEVLMWQMTRLFRNGFRTIFSMETRSRVDHST